MNPQPMNPQPMNPPRVSVAAVRLLRCGLFLLLLGGSAAGCSEHKAREVRPAGPYDTIAIAGGQPAPFYLVNFDRRGRCESPATQAELAEVARTGGFTDVFVISHGWNNDWPAATSLYDDFLRNFEAVRARHDLGRPYRPLFVGVIWPSTLLVTPGEQGPRFESAPAGGPGGSVRSVDEMEQSLARREVRDLAEQLAAKQPAAAGTDPQQVRRIEQELTDLLARGDAQGLAERVATLYDGEDVPTVATTADRAEMLLKAAQSAAQTASAPGTAPPATRPGTTRPHGETRPPRRGAATSPATGPAAPSPAETSPAEAARPEAAPAETTPAAAATPESGELPDLRWIVRVASVLMMKDRAGVVGGNGVAPLVQQLVNAGDARVHLIGHSYGAKVVLSAVASANGLTRPVDSVLLLQPAISAYSFADNVPGAGGPGKYRVAVDASRVRQPVFCTFSENDWPLTQIFHLFVNRRRDLGEAAPAAAAPAVAAAPAPPPNDFAALGGFGPQPLPPQPGTGGEVAWVFLRDEGERYSAKSGNRVIGLRNRGQQIACHGCVSNGHTWWALWNQVAGVPVGQ